MEEKIIGAIEEIADERVESVDANLFDEGVLDSFKVVDLVSELEDIFDIDIDAKYVVEENFCTVKAIVALITMIVGV